MWKIAQPNFLKRRGFRTKFSWNSLIITLSFLICHPLPSDLHPLQVENYDSNSRLVLDEDDNGKFRLQRVQLSYLIVSPQTRHGGPLLYQCWASVVANGSTLPQHWFYISYFPGCIRLLQIIFMASEASTALFKFGSWPNAYYMKLPTVRQTGTVVFDGTPFCVLRVFMQPWSYWHNILPWLPH